jgi:hypothetical protein
MARKPKAVRGKFADEKYLGSEPDLRGKVSNAQIINAYNWYNYFYDGDQAKSWIIEYLKEFYKTEKELIKNVNRIDSIHCRTSGWTCRILLIGGALPQELQDRNLARIKALAATARTGSAQGNPQHDEGGRHASAEFASEEEGSSKEVSREEVNANSRGASHVRIAIGDNSSGDMATGISGAEGTRLGASIEESRNSASSKSARNGKGSKAKNGIGNATQSVRTKISGDELSAGIDSQSFGSNVEEVPGSDSYTSTDSSTEASATNKKEEAQEDSVRHSSKSTVISIQERIANRANDLIADLEVLLDAYYRDGSQFKMSDWIIRNNVKPQVAQRIAAYYKPLYSEAFDALNGKDEDLKEGYSHYKKSQLKAYVEFLRSIVSCAETTATTVKARKPRKKKEKPVSAIVAKLKFKEKDDEYKIVSVDPKQIVGCNQLWVFNTKYRTVAVYNAMGPAGLNVKGSSLIGFDEKTSIVKKLRKPPEQLKKLMEGGKIILRKYMDEVKCKPKEANGRINNETLLLRIIK